MKESYNKELYRELRKLVPKNKKKKTEKEYFEQNCVYIHCDCHHALAVIDHDEDQIYFSHYESGSHSNNQLDWKTRFKFIFKVIWTGNPFTDQLVLDPRKARSLANTLLEKANIVENHRRKNYGI